MAEVFEFIAVFVQQTIGGLGYAGIFLAAFAENIFPPIPSELVMPFAGFLVGRGQFNFAAIVVAGTAGMVLGGLPLYYLGMWADERIIRSFLRRYGKFVGVSERDLERVMALFRKNGGAIVLFGRLIPLVRTLISVPAGMERMPLPKYLFYSTIGSALWTAILGYTGVVLGENWEDVLILIRRYERAALAIMALVAVTGLVVIGVRYLRQRSQPATFGELE